MDQVDNLRAGDIVIWKGEGRTMGMIVDDNPVLCDEPVVLIQFYAGDDRNAGPLQYYYHELDDFLERGEIRIQHG